MVKKLLVKVSAFLKTPTGHALEHAVTAAAATTAGLIVVHLVDGHGLHLTDVHTALAAGVSALVFGVRTAIRNATK